MERAARGLCALLQLLLDMARRGIVSGGSLCSRRISRTRNRYRTLCAGCPRCRTGKSQVYKVGSVGLEPACDSHVYAARRRVSGRMARRFPGRGQPAKVGGERFLREEEGRLSEKRTHNARGAGWIASNGAT